MEWSQHQYKLAAKNIQELSLQREMIPEDTMEAFAIVTISFRAAQPNTQILKTIAQRHKPYTPDFGSYYCSMFSFKN